MNPPIVLPRGSLAESSTPRPLHTYHRHQPPPIVHVPTHVPDTKVIPNFPLLLPSFLNHTVGLPIAIHQGIRPTQDPSPQYKGLWYHFLLPLHYT